MLGIIIWDDSLSELIVFSVHPKQTIDAPKVSNNASAQVDLLNRNVLEAELQLTESCPLSWENSRQLEQPLNFAQRPETELRVAPLPCSSSAIQFSYLLPTPSHTYAWHPSGQGNDSRSACREFEPGSAQDPPCRGADARQICRGSNVFSLEVRRDRCQLRSALETSLGPVALAYADKVCDHLRRESVWEHGRRTTPAGFIRNYRTAKVPSYGPGIGGTMMKNRWNAGILTITNRSASNSEWGPVCDLKTGAEVSKNERCHTTTSIRSTKSHNPSPRQRSRNKCVTRFNHDDLYTRRPAVCIPLTSVHKRARLNWSLKHQHWSVGEWANVMFSDESRFSLSCDSRLVTIWRERGTRFEPRNIMERHFPSRGAMVWTGIMMDGRTDLHFFDTGSVTAQRYRDEVLEPYIACFEVQSVLTSYSWIIMRHVTKRY
ncbi:transposable element Tcb2 transposase [Trichonephila clavipes]|nr:transposable element Tcb2 transposase [Trichonephila clavipes]